MLRRQEKRTGTVFLEFRHPEPFPAVKPPLAKCHPERSRRIVEGSDSLRLSRKRVPVAETPGKIKPRGIHRFEKKGKFPLE
jgi:hypothetical protein